MAEACFVDGKTVPIHTIFAIGRNYAAHAAELNDDVPGSPIVFLKPDTTIIQDGGTIRLPRQSREVHHEAELVVLLGGGGRDIDDSAALDCVAGYGVGIDATARDLQRAAIKEGMPWSVAKGFDTFAPISRFVPAEQVADPHALTLWLDVNGERRQRGSTGDMVFSLPTLIRHLSTIFTLQAGDLIFTGTPHGVGPFEHGDTLEAGLALADSTLLVELRVSASRD
ncbi:MAG: fumarylacetoacetate hydrolase family protein [Chromatiales bacterium]|jgi:2-keto-4-pentenoate hydratase/2-oxohepta-3-ene-1,7-dioic acid hydratase in catechol pathway